MEWSAKWNSKYDGPCGSYTLDKHELHYHLRLRRKSRSTLHPLSYLLEVYKVFFLGLVTRCQVPQTR